MGEVFLLPGFRVADVMASFRAHEDIPPPPPAPALGRGRGSGAAPRGGAPASRNRRSLITPAVAFVATYLTAALLVNALAHSLAGEQRAQSLFGNERETVLWNQLRRLEPERYILFFGPSTTVNNIIPRVVDKTFGQQGVDMYSFNLGLVGASAHEVDYLARRTLNGLKQDGLPLPDCAVIDLTIPHNRRIIAEEYAPIANLKTERSEKWHDFYQTRSVIRTILREKDLSIGLKLWSIALHLEVFARRNLSVAGRWHQWTSEAADASMRDFKLQPIRAHRGYTPFNRTVHAAEREQFLKTGLADYFERLETKRAADTRDELDPPPYNHEAVTDQVNFFREHGVEVVYVIAPTYHPTGFVHSLQTRADLPPFLIYDRPDVFPQFYKPENRQDPGHLSNEAAVKYSRRLALDLYDLLWKPDNETNGLK